MDQNNIFAIGLPFFFALLALEAWVSAQRNLQLYTLQDTLANFGMLGLNILATLSVQAVSFMFYLWVYQYRVIDLSHLPSWLLFLIAVLAIDLCFYWYHRATHRVRLLWAIHVNHHSSEKFNLSVAFRQALFGPPSKLLFFWTLPFFGIDPVIMMSAGAVAFVAAIWTHTQMIGRLGPLEWILNTPSHHRVHHGSNPQYVDKNYGGIFIFWDFLFGTFEPEKEPVVYGLRRNINTFNPLKIAFHYWVTIGKDLKRSTRLGEYFGAIFGPPDWEPKPNPKVIDQGYKEERSMTP